MNRTIDYYFWTSSDWAYFGNPRLKAMARQFKLTINYFPVDLAIVYERTGGVKLALRSEERKNYRLEEMSRFSKLLGMPIVLRPRHPIISNELSSRVIIAAKLSGENVHDLTHAIMCGRWVHDRDIENEQVLIDIANGVGMNGSALYGRATQKDVEETYLRYTDEAIAKGVFGSPFYFFGDQSFWGQDRLEHLQRTIADAR